MIIHLMQMDLRSCGHTCVMMVFAALREDQLLPSLSRYQHPEGMSLHEMGNILQGQSFHVDDTFDWTSWTHFPVIIRCVHPNPHFIVLWERRDEMVLVSDPSQVYEEWRPLSSLKTVLARQLLSIGLPHSNARLGQLLCTLLLVLFDLGSLWIIAQSREVGSWIGVVSVSWMVHRLNRKLLDQHLAAQWKRQVTQWLGDASHRVEEHQLAQMFHVKNARLYERANRQVINIQIVVFLLTLIVTTHWLISMQFAVCYGTYHVLPRVAARCSLNCLLRETTLMTESYHQRHVGNVIRHYHTLQLHYRGLKRWQMLLTILNCILPFLGIVYGEWLPFKLPNVLVVPDELVWFVGMAYTSSMYAWIGMQLIPHSSANNATHMI